MGKCVRIRGSSKPPAAAVSCLTLRSGRRVPPPLPSACNPRTSGRPRRQHRGSAALGGRGAEGDKQRARGSPRPRRRSTADEDDGRPEEEEPLLAAGTGGADDVARCVADGHGDSFDRVQATIRRRPKTPPPLMITDADCDNKTAAKQHGNESRCGGSGVVAADIEAFFAAAELAERRRFAEAYNYDIALDLPLEGRYEWKPLST